MLTLCGFSASNYHNKIKLMLLEKGVPFEERLTWIAQVDRAASPLGKVPYLLTDHGALCESAVIADYLEAAHPAPALVPADPFGAAKVRELAHFLELHLELVARQLYAEAFFGGKLSDRFKERVRAQLEKNIAAFTQLVRFAPYIAGDTFTLADCAAVVHLPVISGATKLIYGQDLLAHLPVRDYMALVGARPHVQRVNADRKENTALMFSQGKP
jgi:glutathione S-transferase